jgi:hypothetical protein
MSKLSERTTQKVHAPITTTGEQLIKPMINFLRAFDELDEVTQACFVVAFMFWSLFLFVSIPAGVVHFSDKLLIQNQPACEEVAQQQQENN